LVSKQEVTPRLLYRIRRSVSSAHELAHGSARIEKRRIATGIVVSDGEKNRNGQEAHR
jgi:hypothetical protein